MRIGLYGLPCAGKTYLLDELKETGTILKIYDGSACLLQINPSFHSLNESEKENVRIELTKRLAKEENLICTGHYAFGNNVVFTENDGNLYDVFVYIYNKPDIIKHRIAKSLKNAKYASENFEEWQNNEIKQLREYCHIHDKDFFIIDNPGMDIIQKEIAIDFIHAIECGFSCVNFAKRCAEKIKRLADDEHIILTDGDKTLTQKDSSREFFDWKTNMFDGNFYTGYQSWRQGNAFTGLFSIKDIDFNKEIDFDTSVLQRMKTQAFILTSGNPIIWGILANKLKMPCFSGDEMSADAKYFIVKFLKRSGFYIEAYGDSLNDLYMLRESDKGYLIKRDGKLSRSLTNIELDGVEIVSVESKQ